MAWFPGQERLTPTLNIETSAVSGITYSQYASTYNMTNIPVPETLAIFLNSGFQRADGIDYTFVTGASSVTFTSLLDVSADNVFATYFWSDVTPVGFEPRCLDHQSVVPAGIRGSTTLNPVVTSYELLAERIKMQLGWPVTNIEICDDEIYDFINQACEWYSKYAGQTEEYLVFDSINYKCGRGLKMDNIINAVTDFYCGCCPSANAQVVSEVTSQFFDCDLNNYRKVSDIFSFDPAGGGSGGGGTGSGSEVLFNMDYLFAQQAYFGQMMGGMGYDLVTWHLLKSWLKDRSRLFATMPYVRFDPRTQTMFITPEPTRGRYIGVIGVWLERSIAQLVQERWVHRYSLALTKIALAFIRGKFGGVTLFGGAQVNPTDLMTQGIAERDKLEEEIMNGFGEAMPISFYRG